MKLKLPFILALCLLTTFTLDAQRRKNKSSSPKITYPSELYDGLQWRNIGPFRGGRSAAVTGVPVSPTYTTLAQPEAGFGEQLMRGTAGKISAMVISAAPLEL